jgi:hypothetical protein
VGQGWQRERGEREVFLTRKFKKQKLRKRKGLF